MASVCCLMTVVVINKLLLKIVQKNNTKKEMSETSIIATVLQTLKTRRFSMTNEKKTQLQLYEILKPMDFLREHRLDKENIPDFFHLQHGIGIEVKIKGSKKDIYRQGMEG